MQEAGNTPAPARLKLVALSIILLAVLLGLFAWQQRASRPISAEASIDAEVVHVAATVGGRIDRLPVHENGRVKAGDLLFAIDPTAYQLALDQARANLKLATATADTQGRMVATQTSEAAIAREGVTRAETNLAHVRRTAERLRPLADANHVPRQQYDAAVTTVRDAEITLREARIRAAAVETAIGSDAGSLATVEAQRAAVANAEHALANTRVTAPHAGRIVGLRVRSGETVAPFQPLFTLITDAEWFAVANFQEGELRNLAVGDCVTVYSMIDRKVPIKGRIESIGTAVTPGGRIDIPRSAPYIERTLEWVKVSQRFPVRIRLASPPDNLMLVGASAVVQVKHGAACR
jgi:multidrug efflux system membrane fusion protein